METANADLFPAIVAPTAVPPNALTGVKFKACPDVTEVDGISWLEVTDGTTGGLVPEPGNSPPVIPRNGLFGSYVGVPILPAGLPSNPLNTAPLVVM